MMKKPIALFLTYHILLLSLVGCRSPELHNDELRATIEKHVTYLASDELQGRDFGTEGELKAALYVAAYFKEIGLEPKGTDEYFQEFNVTPSNNPHKKAKIGESSDSSLMGRNVIGYIDNEAEKTVVIGAHFDHLGSGSIGSLYRGEEAIHNGADDNASGTAAMLQLAQLMKDIPANNNYLFIAFTGEEHGLWGSNYFTKNPTIELSSINYMINYDMVGRLNEKKTIAVHGTGTSPTWTESLDIINTDSLNLVRKDSGVGPSDHTSFYLNDIPVLHFFTGQHDDYHKPTDDADKINYDGIVEIVRYSERLLKELDSKGTLVFTKTKDESKNTPRFKVGLGVVPDYLFDGEGMRIDGISEDKPAQIAGLQKGDIVIKLGDSTIVDMMSYMRALSVFEKGDTTKAVIKRGEDELEKVIVF